MADMTKQLLDIIALQQQASEAKSIDGVITDAVDRFLSSVSKAIETPVMTYTHVQLCDVLHTTSRTLDYLRNCGAIKAIRLGNKFIYRVDEVKKFLKDFDGHDLTNETTIKMAVRQVYGQPVLKQQKNVNPPSKVNSRV